jgi:hypothetical protein
VTGMGDRGLSGPRGPRAEGRLKKAPRLSLPCVPRVYLDAQVQYVYIKLSSRIILL